MTRRILSIAVEEPEYQTITRIAKEEGKTITEVFCERLRAGAIQDHDNLEERLEQVEGVSFDVKKTVDTYNQVGTFGYDITYAASELHNTRRKNGKRILWENMSKADRVYFLTPFKAERPSPTKVDQMIERVASRLKTDSDEVLRVYEDIPVVILPASE